MKPSAWLLALRSSCHTYVASPVCIFVGIDGDRSVYDELRFRGSSSSPQHLLLEIFPQGGFKRVEYQWWCCRLLECHRHKPVDRYGGLCSVEQRAMCPLESS